MENNNQNYNNQNGYDQQGYDQQGYDQQGYNQQGYDQQGYNQQGYYRQDYNQYNPYGYDQYGYDQYGRPVKSFEQQRKEAFKSLADKEKISFVIWLVIGIIQCLSFVTIIAGVWNIYAAIQTYNFTKQLDNCPRGVYARYEGQMNSLIISLVLNIIFGGVIGVVGTIYDYFTRDYVMKNRDFFE